MARKARIDTGENGGGLTHGPLIRPTGDARRAVVDPESGARLAAAVGPIIARFVRRPARAVLAASTMCDAATWIARAAHDAATPVMLFTGGDDMRLFAQVDAPLTAVIADGYFGGGSAPMRSATRPAPGRGERALIEKLLTRFGAVLNPDRTDAVLARAWTAGGRAACPLPDATLLESLTLEVSLDGRAAGRMTIARVADAPAAAPPPRRTPTALWQQRLATALGEINLPARAVLARPMLNLSALARLRRGDIIPLGVPAKVPLVIGARCFARGTIGECGGAAAFQIETLQQEILP
ncbi:MAG: hypothetical protein RLZZ58_975 [Pseudomonadota bacterium]